MQFVAVCMQHASVEHAVEPADDRLERDLRNLPSTRRELERVADEVLETGARLLATRDPRGPDGRDLEQAQPQRARIVDRRVEQRADPGFDAVRPAVGLAVSALDPACRLGHDQVERDEQALLLVFEVLVERLARDARARDHVRHARRAVAVLRDRVDHRERQAPALFRARSSPRRRARRLARVRRRA